jgi:hypothetical protein
VLARKKKNVFVYFNDSRVYREKKKKKKKILSNSQLTPAVLHCSFCCYCAGWKKKKFICLLMIKMGLYINGFLKFWDLPNFEALSHCLNGFKDGPGLVSSLILSPLQPSPILIGSRIPLTNILRMVQ